MAAMEVKVQRLIYHCNICSHSVVDLATSEKLKLHEEKKYVCLSCEKKKEFPKYKSYTDPHPWNSTQIYDNYVLKISYDNGGYHHQKKTFTVPMIKLFTLQDIQEFDLHCEIDDDHPHLKYYPSYYGCFCRIVSVEVIKKSKITSLT